MSFCSNCGNQLGDGERFCGKCGAPVGGATQPNQQNNQYQQYQPQGSNPVQPTQPVTNQPNFISNAKVYGKKAVGATDTFLSNNFGAGLNSKKMLYMLMLLGVMVFVLIFMLPNSFSTHLKIETSSYLKENYTKSELRDYVNEVKERVEDEVKEELALLFGAAKVVDIIFNFLPMLAATLVACIPFFKKGQVWKRGYLLFLRIFLFYNAGNLILSELIYIIFNSTVGTQSYWTVKYTYSLSLSAAAVIRLLLEIVAIVLTFMVRKELLKEQTPAVPNPYNYYPNNQVYTTYANPQDSNNNSGS